jgi:hypothetical protein
VQLELANIDKWTIKSYDLRSKKILEQDGEMLKQLNNNDFKEIIKNSIVLEQTQFKFKGEQIHELKVFVKLENVNVFKERKMMINKKNALLKEKKDSKAVELEPLLVTASVNIYSMPAASSHNQKTPKERCLMGKASVSFVLGFIELESQKSVEITSRSFDGILENDKSVLCNDNNENMWACDIPLLNKGNLDVNVLCSWKTDEGQDIQKLVLSDMPFELVIADRQVMLKARQLDLKTFVFLNDAKKDSVLMKKQNERFAVEVAAFVTYDHHIKPVTINLCIQKALETLFKKKSSDLTQYPLELFSNSLYSNTLNYSEFDTSNGPFNSTAKPKIDTKIDMREKKTPKSQATTLKPRGISNTKNWCYVNASVQAILACQPIYFLIETTNHQFKSIN